MLKRFIEDLCSKTLHIVLVIYVTKRPADHAFELCTYCVYRRPVSIFVFIGSFFQDHNTADVNIPCIAQLKPAPNLWAFAATGDLPAERF